MNIMFEQVQYVPPMGWADTEPKTQSQVGVDENTYRVREFNPVYDGYFEDNKGWIYASNKMCYYDCEQEIKRRKEQGDILQFEIVRVCY